MSPKPSGTLITGLVWAVVVLLIGGYRFGVADHGIHLPMLDMVLHPDRWQGDLLFVAADAHPSWFSRLQAPFAEAAGVAAWSAALYFVVMAATGALLMALARVLGLGLWAAWVALLVLAVPHAVPGGAATLDPLLLHRTAALPVELAAVWFFLRNRDGWAFLVCGLAAGLHAPSALALGFGLAFGYLVRARLLAVPTPEVGGVGLGEAARTLLLPPAAFAAGASPLVVPWMWGAGPGRSLVRVDDAWWEVLVTRVPHHVVPQSWGMDVWGPFILWMVLAAGSGLVLVRWVEDRRRELLAWIAVATGCLVYAFAVGSVAGPVARIALASQVEAWQATRFVLIAAVLVTVGAVFELWARAPKRALIAGVLALLVAGASASDAPRRFEPFGPDGAEADVARWAAANTSDGARFLLPPGSFGAFRALALRPVVTTWKDGGEATFARDVAMEWLRRMERVCACEPRGSGGISGLRERVTAGWKARSLEGIRQTAVQEDADWIVVELERAENPVHVAGPWAVLAAPESTRRAP